VSIWNTASPAGELQEEYYVGNQRVAYFANNMLHFQHQDWTGTERMRTAFNGAVEGTFTSMPFGDAFGTLSGIDGDPYHYALLDHDYSSDTDHAQFRQYSSTPGRWMSPDPYSGSYHMRNPQSFNRYSYALNNPMSLVDPSGLYCVYFGATDENYDGAETDGDVDQATCEGDGPEGGGTWEDGASETVSVNGDGSGDSLSFYTSYSDGQIASQTATYFQFSGSGSNNPNNPCKTGFGVGVVGGADATAGLGYGAGANVSGGAGVFAGNQGLDAGGFASGGVAASLPGYSASAPSQNMIGRFFAGLVAGAGAGFFVTNASQASQLNGRSGTWTVDLGNVLNGAGQFSAGTDASGNAIWSFSFTIGAGAGIGYQQLTNNTKAKGIRKGC
jgi:RHS repeat-associated protein